jgi:TolA-binding protein
MTSSRVVVLLAAIAFLAMAAPSALAAEKQVWHPVHPGGPKVLIDAHTTLRAVQAVEADNRNRITSCEQQLAEIGGKVATLEEGRVSDLETTTETIGAVDDRVTELENRAGATDSRLAKLGDGARRGRASLWLAWLAIITLAIGLTLTRWVMRRGIRNLRDCYGKHHHGDGSPPARPAPNDEELFRRSAAAARRIDDTTASGQAVYDGSEIEIDIDEPPPAESGSDDASGPPPLPMLGPLPAN